jgi:hypothetical protein
VPKTKHCKSFVPPCLLQKGSLSITFPVVKTLFGVVKNKSPLSSRAIGGALLT